MITDIKKAIAGEQLDGWLFFNFLHRDRIADRILGISQERMNSRPWYYLVPETGEPLKLCNAVEPDSLNGLPGELKIYRSRDELIGLLNECTGRFGFNWGAQFSEELTAVSTLDHGTALMLQAAGIKLQSSAGLIQRLNGLIDADGIKSHEAAAVELYTIIELLWSRVSEHFLKCSEPGWKPLKEREVQQWILDEFESRGMVTEHMPIVACGANSGNPHYAPEDHDNIITADSVLQFDIWAKLNKPGSIFADISWAGWTGPEAPEAVESVFNAVRDARDRCTAFISGSLEQGKQVSGFDADRETRQVLIDRGYEALIKHRTGHGIDVDVHGSGAGLDSVEFPDRRLLLEGSCFSVEPGLYSADFGIRTEIDAYINNGKLVVSGGSPQIQLLTIKD